MSDPQSGSTTTSGHEELAWDLYAGGHDALVVVSHGIFGHRRLPELERLARRLAQRFDVLTLDCRGHGDSTGRFSFGQHEWRDLADIVEGVRHGYRSVGGIGFSFGGFHTCVAAAKTGCFDAAMLVSTPKDFFIADHMPSVRGLWKQAPLMAKRDRKRTRLGVALGKRTMPIDCIAGVEAPLHIVHGDADWLIHHRHAVELHRKAPLRTPLTLLDGGLHAEYLVEQMPERFLPLVSRWFEETLTEPGAG